MPIDRERDQLEVVLKDHSSRCSFLPRLICLALAAYTVALYFSIITSNSAILATTRLIALHARGPGGLSTCYPPPTFGEWTIAEPNDWIKQACRDVAISPPFQRNSGTKWLKACLPGKKPRSLVRSGLFLITPAFVVARVLRRFVIHSPRK
jgi:hypothetical protein